MKNSQTKLILFDFDGTIADTFDAVIDAFNHLSAEFGFRYIPDTARKGLRDKTSQEIFKSLGIPWLKIPLVVARLRQEAIHGIDQIKPFAGIEKVLSQLSQLHPLRILTSNREDTVRRFLQKCNLNYFSCIDSEIEFFGKDRMLIQLIKKQKRKPTEIVYIGDETRDVEAAKKAGIRCIAVSWGFASKKALQNAGASMIVEHPVDLINALKGLALQRS